MDQSSDHVDNRQMATEHEVEEIFYANDSSRASQFALLVQKFRTYVIRDPENRLYKFWTHFILIWAVYSSFFTPLEFGFFCGLPRNILFLDVTSQILFLADIVIQFLLAYRDSHTYCMIYNRTSIALRYLRSDFVLDFLSCLPWDLIYKLCGRKEEIRYLLLIRLCRVRKMMDFFRKMEKDIRINYFFTRIVKLIIIELYCMHTVTCIFYYFSTTLPQSKEDYTLIGSLKLDEFNYQNFRELDFWRRYWTSLYFTIMSMTTVGYGDMHAVNIREIIFIMIFYMILGSYLIGNLTALILKGSKTERFRDKMNDLNKYMDKKGLEKDICEQIKGRLQLQYGSNYTKAYVLQDIPVSVRAMISKNLFKPYIENVQLFRGCTSEFIHQIAIKLQEEFFLPGEVILDQGNSVHQLYFVCHGLLEGVRIDEDGTEEIISQFGHNSSFGEIAVLRNLPQPFTVRVCELCRILQLDKQSFTNILDVYFVDSRTILNNLLESDINSTWIKQFGLDIKCHIGRQESELALKVNNAAFHGDLHHLKALIRAGANPRITDYDGRSPLHIVAKSGFANIAVFLLQEGVDINAADKYGTTPLLEAIKCKHGQIVTLLFNKGAKLYLDDAGTQLCAAVSRGDSDFLKRILACGADPNSKNYEQCTPLHITAKEGLYSMTNLLLNAGASVFAKDRRGTTPMDEALKGDCRKTKDQFMSARFEELEFLNHCRGIIRGKTKRQCGVGPLHPRDPRILGSLMWIPQTMKELIQSSIEQLQCSGTYIISKEGVRIRDVDLIVDRQHLYLISDNDLINNIAIET